jgi:hypothetical protein
MYLEHELWDLVLLVDLAQELLLPDLLGEQVGGLDHGRLVKLVVLACRHILPDLVLLHPLVVALLDEHPRARLVEAVHSLGVLVHLSQHIVHYHAHLPYLIAFYLRLSFGHHFIELGLQGCFVRHLIVEYCEDLIQQFLHRVEVPCHRDLHLVNVVLQIAYLVLLEHQLGLHIVVLL